MGHQLGKICDRPTPFLQDFSDWISEQTSRIRKYIFPNAFLLTLNFVPSVIQKTINVLGEFAVTQFPCHKPEIFLVRKTIIHYHTTPSCNVSVSLLHIALSKARFCSFCTLVYSVNLDETNSGSMFLVNRTIKRVMSAF